MLDFLSEIGVWNTKSLELPGTEEGCPGDVLGDPGLMECGNQCWRQDFVPLDLSESCNRRSIFQFREKGSSESIDGFILSAGGSLDLSTKVNADVL